MNLEICDKHDYCIVVWQSDVHPHLCPICELEKVMDKLRDRIKELDDTIGRLEKIHR